jgi:hypothetical protein
MAELACFTRGLQEDLAAVKAGLTLDWSNRVTEGQIQRLKLLKRQGYGRAGGQNPTPHLGAAILSQPRGDPLADRRRRDPPVNAHAQLAT